jgi:hypothetical protein
MRRMAIACAVAWLLAPARARATESVSVEVGVGESKPTPTLQPSAFEYQKLAGHFEPSDTLYMSASLRLTRDFMASPTAGTSLRTGTDWAWMGTFDTSVDLTKHWTVDLGIHGSPSATRDVAAPLTYPTSATATSDAYALVRASTSSLGASVEASYDSFDEGAPERFFDASLDLSAAFTRFGTMQMMTELDAPGVPVSSSEYLASCAHATSPLCDVVQRASGGEHTSLNQVRLGATVTGTFGAYTDIALDFGYSIYDTAHPGDVGFFSYVPAGGGGQQASYGAGLAMVPPRWALRPEVGHKWRSLSVRAWYQYTDYAIFDYVGDTVGGKVQLYLGAWRPYATGSYRVDFSSGETARTWTAALGLTRVF